MSPSMSSSCFESLAVSKEVKMHGLGQTLAMLRVGLWGFTFVLTYDHKHLAALIELKLEISAVEGFGYEMLCRI